MEAERQASRELADVGMSDPKFSPVTGSRHIVAFYEGIVFDGNGALWFASAVPPTSFEQNYPEGIAVDATNLYWTVEFSGTIMTAPK